MTQPEGERPVVTDEMIDAELERQRKRRKIILFSAIGVVALIAVVAITAVVTVVATRSSDDTSDQAATTTTATTAATTSETAESFAIGEPVANGGVTVTVDEVTNPATYPRMTNSMRKNSGYDEYAPVSPRAGGKFVRVDATVLNSGSKAIDLTCSWPINAIVADSSNRIYQPVDSLHEIEGTPECNEDLNPGFESKMTWIYEVPSAANVRLFGFADTDVDSQDISIVRIGDH